MSSFLYFTSLINLCSILFYSNEGVQGNSLQPSNQPKQATCTYTSMTFSVAKTLVLLELLGHQTVPLPPSVRSTMIDDALTEKQDPTSKIVGRTQGFYSVASQGRDEFAFLVVMNLVFVEGKYKGSSISVIGRNPVMNDVREMPIVGGTGLFRFARGYVLAHTVWFDPNIGDAIVEYNVFVSHN